MYWAIDYMLEKYRNGRKLAVWSGDVDPNHMNINIAHDIDFYISNKISLKGIIKNGVEIPKKILGLPKSFLGRPICTPPHENKKIDQLTCYIVIACPSPEKKKVREILLERGFLEYVDFYDYWSDGYLLTDVFYKNIFIGKCAKFFNVDGCPKHGKFNVINESLFKVIGRFSMINHSAMFIENTAMNMLVKNDAFTRFLDENGKQEWETLTDNVLGRGEITIGDNVWIGAGVVVNCSKCHHIGNGAIIGSNTVITHDIPPYAVVYGNPAKIQRYSFTPEQINIVERVKWWNWNNDTLQKNAKLILYPEKFFEKYRYENDRLDGYDR